MTESLTSFTIILMIRLLYFVAGNASVIVAENVLEKHGKLIFTANCFSQCLREPICGLLAS